jgi:hypothetical protein
MRRISLLFAAFSLFLLTLSLTGPLAQAQSPLEEWAKQQISEKTGIDPNLLATLFVTEGQDQFILAFVYITEEVLASDLKPELKEAISPFVGRRAMLTLAVPTRTSRFSPLEISFSQDGLFYLISRAQIHQITEDFLAGELKANRVSAGVIELPEGLDLKRPFQIIYRGTHSTTFALEGQEASGQETGPLFGFLFFLLQILLFFLLFPFLIGI